MDITDATWQNTYGVSAENAAIVAQGRSDGTFRPKETVNRGQFAKMTTSGLEISAMMPEVPTFRDVSPDYPFFSYVEGCTAAGVLSGYSDGSFRPGATVTRQQTSSILGHWLAEREITACLGIVGAKDTYSALKAWYAGEGKSYLAGFADAQSLSPAHQATTAYLVSRGIVMGSSTETSSYLRATASVNRAQAVTLVLRAREEAAEVTQPAVISVEPATGIPAGGNTVVIRGHGFVEVSGVWFGETPAANFSVISPLEIVAVAPQHDIGIVDIEVATAWGTSVRSGADVYTYAWNGLTDTVLTGGQTPLRGVWNGTAERLASYLLAVAPAPLFTVPTSVLADYYVRYCAEAGLRADLLWAQMIHETGYGMYGGDVSPEQNNYAGIGATGGGVPGLSFPTAEAGVMAQVAHMVAYVYIDSPVSWADATVDPRFDLVSPRGVAAVLADLNGRWAYPGTTYGQSIEALARAINSD
ncbi:MAG: S-layer homology domain-containing protein [Thermoleophilia bacterium]|nr:S-layer homology domain-containing protein [Thermoleophilia bacterium]